MHMQASWCMLLKIHDPYTRATSPLVVVRCRRSMLQAQGTNLMRPQTLILMGDLRPATVPLAPQLPS